MLGAAVIAIAIWWLRSPADEPQVQELSEASDVTASASGFVSAIRPVSQASAQDAAQTGILFNSLDPNLQSGVTKRFSEALDVQTQGDYLAAEELLSAIIKDYPQLVEPYANLAAVYSKTNQLEKAQLTLVRGLTANPSTAILFKSLQKVHGAQAAQAYQQALSDAVEPAALLELPLLNSIALSPLPQTESAEQSKAAKAASSQVASLTKEITNLKSQYESRIASLQKELANQSLLVDNSLKPVTLPDAVVAVAPDVNPQTADAEVAKQPEETEASRLAALEKSQAEQKERTEKELVQKRQKNAIDAVKRWASAWSNQNVNDYVASYTDSYVPSGSGLSHSQWVAQRRDRLGNKKFIKVNVSRFKVEDLGARFSVQFSQNYQSNTINDIITKKLTFVKGGEDWTGAKIVNEKVISG